MEKENENVKKQNKKPNKKNIIIIGSILIILAIAVSVGRIVYINEKIKKFSDLILPGVKIENIDLSSKTKEQAKDILKNKLANQILKKQIHISTRTKIYTIDYSKLNPKYNIDDAVNEAYSYGRNLGIFEEYDLIKNPKNTIINLKFSYDSKYVKVMITSIEKDVNKAAVNSSITLVAGGKFKITPEIKGTKLLSEKLEKDILGKIDGKLNSNVTIVAEMEDVNPTITEEKLSTINTKVSTFSTNFASSMSQRANNIVLATNSINGTVIMPGGTFSFNKIVGKRTTQRGYQEAPVIIGNKVDSGIGGGICQVSGTLYNAILRSDIMATQRTHHTLPSTYVPKGFDATVDYGNIDYQFVNTLPYPIYIESSAQNRNIAFNVYSNSSLTKKSYVFYNDIYETIQPKTHDVLDGSLKVGNRIIDQIAYIGYKVKVFKKTIENGAIISTQLVSNDYYKQVDGIVRIGTKKI